MTSYLRAYVVGLPVAIGIWPDGSVVVDVDLSDAADAIRSPDRVIPLSSYPEGTIRGDAELVGDACGGARPLLVTSSATDLLSRLVGDGDPRNS